MATEVETTLRGPEAFSLARKAMEAMEAAGAWPTPLNYEIWLHYVGDPEGPLGREITRLLSSQEPFTEGTAEMLAAEFLPRGRLSEEIRDAGALLNRELSSVASAIAQAQKTQAAYGETLAGASASIEQVDKPESLRQVVTSLSAATAKVREENAHLESRLEDSTKEVARLREHLEQVRRDAMTDALTNLANRKAFDEELLRACDDAERAGTEVTLSLIDIDHFKRFNDTWGHQTGDQVLRYVASVIGRVAKPLRFAARYGGEEFAMIFVGESAAEAENVLNAIRQEIGSRALRRRSTDDELGAVTISAGVAQRHRGESGSQILDRADAALYVSKHNGRDRVTNGERMRTSAAA